MKTKTNPQETFSLELMARDIQGTVVRARELFEQSNFTVEKKADGSPVTMIDTEIQKVLIRICLDHLGPSVHFVAEEDESGTTPSSETWWVFIDPIDGTTPLCAGDPSNACIAVGIFKHGAPYVGYVAKLGDLSVMYGGIGVGMVAHINRQGKLMQKREIANENKMWCMDYATSAAGNTVMTMLYNRIVANRSLGGYPYNVPSIASALKLIEGHAKFFVGANSKPWDVAAVMPMLQYFGYTFNSLETRKPIRLDGSRDKVPAFVMSTAWDDARRIFTLYDALTK